MEVDVWPVRLTFPGSDVVPFETLLSDDESKRASRFRFDKHRQAFVASRGILRILLQDYLGEPANTINIAYGEKGKPKLAKKSNLHFNASHSGDLAVFAFTRGHELGVDVELIRETNDLSAIAKRFFCAEEYQELMSLPFMERQPAFFRCWTRKEAYIKALGEGLSVPLDQFQVTLLPQDPARFVHIGHDTKEAANWTIHNLDIKTGYAGAIAYKNRPREIRLREFRLPDTLWP